MRTDRVDQPWKRMLSQSVSDSRTKELLAIVVPGPGIDEPVLDSLAREIDAGDLASAAGKPDELRARTDFHPAAADALMAAFELARRAAVPLAPTVLRGPGDVAAIARRAIGGLRQEHLLVIACDTANRLLRSAIVSHGAVDLAPMPVREVLNAVLSCDGRAFAIAHNHPNGDPEPSDNDISATERIADAARVVGLRFLGHVVVAAEAWESVAAKPGPQR